MKPIFVVFVFVALNCWAEEEIKSAASGPGKAVLETSKEQGFRLSEKAKSTIGIKTMKLTASFQTPGSALIHERGEFGVYIKKGEWFKYIEIEVEKPFAQNIKIDSSKIHVGDEIVVSDVSLLRLAELNLSGGGSDND